MGTLKFKFKKDKVIDRFIENIVSEIFNFIELDKNNLNAENKTIDKTDVPLMIASLKQGLSELNYDDAFLEDLYDEYSACIESKHSPMFDVEYIPDYTGGWTYGIIKLHTNYTCFNIYFHVERWFNSYCTCSEEDEGYRKDKWCCGINCDWDKCNVVIKEEKDLMKFNFKGTQSDYWKFEDAFYDKYPEVKLTKKIEELTLELAELEMALSKLKEQDYK